MEDDSRKLTMPYIAFQRTSTRPIPWKSVTPPLGIITTICQAHGVTRSTPLKATCMSTTTSSQFPGSGSSSRFATRCYILRCSAFIPKGPPAQCSQCRINALAISSPPRIVSSTGKRYTLMGIGITGDGTRA